MTRRQEDQMLKDSKAFSGFAVPDIMEAKRFYGETLGLEVTEEEMGVLGIKLGSGATLMVYPKDDHQPANYTILNFPIDDIDTAVDRLAEKGVEFERYDGFNQDEKGIARPTEEQPGPEIAWFTDPAGNILSVLSEAPA